VCRGTNLRWPSATSLEARFVPRASGCCCSHVSSDSVSCLSEFRLWMGPLRMDYRCEDCVADSLEGPRSDLRCFTCVFWAKRNRQWRKILMPAVLTPSTKSSCVLRRNTRAWSVAYSRVPQTIFQEPFGDGTITASLYLLRSTSHREFPQPKPGHQREQCTNLCF
jgi:hypothetical protein